MDAPRSSAARAARTAPAAGLRGGAQLPRPRRGGRARGPRPPLDLHQVPELHRRAERRHPPVDHRADWEVELVAVIGARAHRVAEGQAWEHIAGLTVGQDISERRVQFRPPNPQFSLGKSFPTFGPIGPVLVTPDELPDPDDLEIRCSVNGEEMQRSLTGNLIFPVPKLVAELSAILPLLPGDLIFTGTPSGVGSSRDPRVYLKPGDVIVSEIAGIGRMSNRC